jgi:hypothetical protein
MQIGHADPTLNIPSQTLNSTYLILYPASFCQVRVDVRLPNDDISAVAYEPTRGLGHCQGQFCGIVPSPTVSCVEVSHLTRLPNQCVNK